MNVVVPGSIAYYLIEDGKITEEQLKDALESQKESKNLIGVELVARGFCTELDIAKAMEKKTGYKFVSIEEVGINFAIANIISPDLMAKRGILPLNARYINKAIVLPSKQEKRRKSRAVFTKDEINKLWKIKDVNEYAKIILVYLYTGLRFSELYKLDPDDCHADYIEVKNAKTAAGNRIVPLSDKVKSLLPIIKVPSRNALERHLKKIFPDHLIHETRHTFITMLTETGADPRIIKAIVGHATNDVTDVYTHISLGPMLDAVNKL
jgi:integrase